MRAASRLFAGLLLLSASLYLPLPALGKTATDAEEVAKLKAAAGRGDASAQNELGNLLNSGEKGVAKDHVAAMHWWTLAANQNSFAATMNLGLAYNPGKDLPGLETKSADLVAWYRTLAEHGLPMAQHFLATMYAVGNGVTRDDVQAVHWWREAAKKHNALAEVSLGYFYEAGYAKPENDIPAKPWYQRGADVDAPDSLSAMLNAQGYLSGIGGTRDDRMAILWLRLAAEMGNVDGQKELAFAYANGLGISKNIELANAWYQKAALLGDVQVQAQLGFQYHEGNDGVAKDDAQALRWFRLAAAQGNVMSQFMAASLIGETFQTSGHKVIDDAAHDEATKWMHQAAEQGFGMAERFLAQDYERGWPLATSQDLVLAYVWYSRDETDKVSRHHDADRLRAQLDPKQLAQAEKQIHGWEAKESKNAYATVPFRSVMRQMAKAN